MRLLNDGGPVMYIILVMLLLSLFFIVSAFLNRTKDDSKSKKMIGLAVDSSLLALVIGCLGSLVGIIDLFDMAEALGETRPDLFASKLKVSLLTITFGVFSFILGRIGILAYRWSLNSEVDS